MHWAVDVEAENKAITTPIKTRTHIKTLVFLSLMTPPEKI
jgi:hypothetical protein